MAKLDAIKLAALENLYANASNDAVVMVPQLNYDVACELYRHFKAEYERVSKELNSRADNSELPQEKSKASKT